MILSAQYENNCNFIGFADTFDSPSHKFILENLDKSNIPQMCRGILMFLSEKFQQVTSHSQHKSQRRAECNQIYHCTRLHFQINDMQNFQNEKRLDRLAFQGFADDSVLVQKKSH